MKSFFLCLLWSLSASAGTYIVQYHPDPQVEATLNLMRNSQGVIQVLQAAQQNREADLRANFPRRNLRIESLWISEASIVEMSPEEATTLRQSKRFLAVKPVQKVSLIETLDSLPGAFQYPYGLKKIGLPQINSLYPQLKGAGVRVGVLDTGIDGDHPAFQNRSILYRNFLNEKQTTPEDDHGHGSHVAGTIGASPVGNRKVGLAPEVEFIIGKVFDRRGDSDDAKTLKALQWMADPDGNPATHDQPQVINGSWNVDDLVGESNSFENPFCITIENLERIGILSVFAAGNDSYSNRIKVPGACLKAITVGSTTSQDTRSDFSSQGPVKWKDQQLNKPDVSAPGSSIESVDSGGSWTTKSGTSMASPHVAGALALLIQEKRDPQLARQLLIEGVKDLGAAGFDFGFGWGRIDLVKSLQE